MSMLQVKVSEHLDKVMTDVFYDFWSPKHSPTKRFVSKLGFKSIDYVDCHKLTN